MVWNPGSKRVEEDNLRLQICPSLILGGSTVWHLNPNRSGGVIILGFEICSKSQIGWFNGLAFGSKHVGGDLTWGLPKLQIGGSTVWNLSPNRLRSDLTWGLPKLQIGWFNGLESQSKQVEG
jgi:hypothetical protein